MDRAVVWREEGMAEPCRVTRGDTCCEARHLLSCTRCPCVCALPCVERTHSHVHRLQRGLGVCSRCFLCRHLNMGPDRPRGLSTSPAAVTVDSPKPQWPSAALWLLLVCCLKAVCWLSAPCGPGGCLPGAAGVGVRSQAGASPSCHVRPWGLATLVAVSSSEGPTSGTEPRPSLLSTAALWPGQCPTGHQRPYFGAAAGSVSSDQVQVTMTRFSPSSSPKRAPKGCGRCLPSRLGWVPQVRLGPRRAEAGVQVLQ